MGANSPDPSSMHDPDLDGPLVRPDPLPRAIETRPPSAWIVLLGLLLMLVVCPIAWAMTWHMASIAVGRPWWIDEPPPAPGRPSFAEAFPPLAGGGVAFLLATFIACFFFAEVPCPPDRGKLL